jgi:uncharacterized protein (TIGR03032 family)
MADPTPEPRAGGVTGRPPPPLRSVHTAGFPAILDELGASVAVTTYQAGKLVLLRSERSAINTHFRTFRRPMGLAVAGGRLAVGTAAEIWEFHDVPAVAPRLDARDASCDDTGGGRDNGQAMPPPPRHVRHDGCFLPRWIHVTGDVQVHEMAWAEDGGNGGLWFVNTRFSCLCTRDDDDSGGRGGGGPRSRHNFVPRWRPPFVSALAPEDRCHLNGLGVRDGRPRYATALGATDTAGGWRAGRRGGGVVLDVPAGDVLASGLSMPHSPRWHDGRLWVLESGTGGVGIVDLAAGRYEEVARLPGFTRGLDFAGCWAFVGLSQVRESAVFSGVAVAERPAAERCCGVWVLDLRTGHTAAFLRFEDAVQEVFAVQVLHGVRWPDVITDDDDDGRRLIADSFVLPDEALAGTVPTGPPPDIAAPGDRPH